jgi:hypothetical protein
MFQDIQNGCSRGFAAALQSVGCVSSLRYTLGIKSRVGVGRCTVGFICCLRMAYPDAKVGLLPTLESPWASLPSRFC